MITTIRPMLAEPSAIGLMVVLVLAVVATPSALMALVLLLRRSRSTSTARINALWILPLLFTIAAIAMIVIIKSNAQRNDAGDHLTPAEFFQALDSNRIVQATIFRDQQSPLVQVRGTYKRQDPAETVTTFVAPKMFIPDRVMDRLTSLPNAEVIEQHATLLPIITTFLPFVCALIFVIAVVSIVVGLISAAKRFAARAPPVQSTVAVQPLPRQCPKCGAQLKPDVPEGLCPACLLQHGIATEGGAPPGTTAFTPPPLLELAKLFPQLEILEIIGQGGMGAVYKARQPALDRFVALKILAPRSGGDLDFAGRFSREARALAKLSHPNIVNVYDYGQVQRAPNTPPSTLDPQPLNYFIMEYVDGLNLRQVEQAGKLSPREALEIIPQICAALQFAHDEGIVHRDIKPENVLLDKKGRVKIADFGLAKILGQDSDFRLTGARDVMGTPHYMAPEQVEKPQEVDHRADIYSLGVVFYEMLTGELPLGKFDPPSHKVQIDVRVDDVVLRSLANNPDRRYQHVSEVKTELDTIAHTPQAGAKVRVSESTHFLRTNLGIALGVFTTLIIIAFLGLFGGIAIPNFIRGRNEARAQRAPAQAEVDNSNANSKVRITSNPPASAETWAPTIPPGEKPDLQKILDEADDLMKRGQYEPALGRHIWLQRHQTEYGGSVQNISALSSWIELGRRFPKAMQALIEIRDSEVREFAEGRGYADLFRDIVSINQQLQDENATYELFKAIREGDPRLADQCYLWVEGLLIAKGEYQFCYDHIGDPQSRLSQAKRNFDMQISMSQRSAANQERSRQQMAEFNRQHGSTNLPIPAFPDTSDTIFRYATNAFVDTAGKLIEVLLGTGHATEAEQIRGQALSVMQDPRLESAIVDAEERIHKRKTAPPGTSTKIGQGTNSAYSNLKIPAPGQWHPATTNKPDASRETWEPSLAPGAKPDLMAILQEANELMSKGLYEEALQRQIWYHNHSISDPSQLGVRNSFALADWVELGRRYPEAMQALLEIRDENERKISSGEGYFDLFMETASMNDELGNQERTYTLFKKIASSDKKLAQQCYSIVEGLLASYGDYELCTNYIGDPEKRFKKLQDQWQRSKKWEQQQEDRRRQVDERMQAAQKQSESNGIASASWPQPAISSLPKLADKTFVAQTRQLIEILVGVDDKNDAEKIQRESMLLLEDPALKSAVDDAEKKIHGPEPSTQQNRAPSLGLIAPPTVLPPPAARPAPNMLPQGKVIRPLRRLPIRQTNMNSFTQSYPMTPAEQTALIEIERIKGIQETNPIDRILPPTALSAPANPTNRASSTRIDPLTSTPVAGTNRP